MEVHRNRGVLLLLVKDWVEGRVEHGEVELGLNYLLLQILIMKKLNGSLEVQDYTNSFYLINKQRLTNIEE